MERARREDDAIRLHRARRLKKIDLCPGVPYVYVRSTDVRNGLVYLILSSATRLDAVWRALRPFNPFPYHLTLSVKSIYETIPTPPRAAGDRSRGPRYMVWIGTMDPYPKRPHSRRRPRPPCLRSRPRRCRRRRPVTVRWKSMSRDRNARSDRRHGLCVMQVSHADDAVAEIPRVRYFSRLHVPPSHRR